MEWIIDVKYLSAERIFQQLADGLVTKFIVQIEL